jgi:hypothetical protein
MPSAPSNDEVEAQDDSGRVPFATPEQESAPVTGTEEARLVLDPALENDDGIWTTIVRKQHHKGAPAHGDISKANSDLAQTLSEAEQRLTTEDRFRICMRGEVEASARRAETESSNEEELRDRKGKGPDPANWGQLDVPGDDLDIDMQHAMLAQWNDARTPRKQAGDGPSTDSDRTTEPSELTVVGSRAKKKRSGKNRLNKKSRAKKHK